MYACIHVQYRPGNCAARCRYMSVYMTVHHVGSLCAVAAFCHPLPPGVSGPVSPKQRKERSGDRPVRPCGHPSHCQAALPQALCAGTSIAVHQSPAAAQHCSAPLRQNPNTAAMLGRGPGPAEVGPSVYKRCPAAHFLRSRAVGPATTASSTAMCVCGGGGGGAMPVGQQPTVIGLWATEIVGYKGAACLNPDPPPPPRSIEQTSS